MDKAMSCKTVISKVKTANCTTLDNFSFIDFSVPWVKI